MVALGTLRFLSHVLLAIRGGHLHHLLRLCYWRAAVRRSAGVWHLLLLLVLLVRWLYRWRTTHRRRWSLPVLHWVLRRGLAAEVLGLWARWLR